jgi:hypothetical protein
LPKLLKDIVIDEVSLVDDPANAGSRVIMSKRDDRTGIPEYPSPVDLALAIAKAFHPTEETMTIDSATARQLDAVIDERTSGATQAIQKARALKAGGYSERFDKSHWQAAIDLCVEALQKNRKGLTRHAAVQEFYSSPAGAAMYEAYLKAGSPSPTVLELRPAPIPSPSTAQIDAAATAMMKLDPRLTLPQARARAMHTDPQLYDAYLESAGKLTPDGRSG